MRLPATIVLIAGAGLALAGAPSQQPPADTEVFVAAYSGSGRDALTVGALTNISRNPGYDNQPSFLPDGTGLLFVSNRDGKQTDVYRYDFDTGRTRQLTRTTEAEYSPTVTPDGRTFSVVRVEADGTQRLWRFDPDGSNPRLVLASIKPVGYHAWIDATHLALFVLGDGSAPATLQLADTPTDTAEVVASGIGRSILVRPPGRTVSFVSQPRDGRWTIQELEPATRRIAPIIQTADENRAQDCAWAPDGTLFMAVGATLRAWSPGASGWREAADLSGAGVARITRLAFSPSTARAGGPLARLALVAEPVGR